MIKKRIEFGLLIHSSDVKAKDNLEKTEDNISAALTVGADGNTEWVIIEFSKLPTILKNGDNSIKASI